MRSAPEATSSFEPAARLRTLIVFDSGLAAGGGVFAIVVALTVARLPTLFWLGVFVIVVAVVIASALRPLGRDDVDGALLRISLANWVVAVGATIVATFAWPLLMQAALLPSVLAVSFASGRRLRRYVGVSFVAAIAVACLGLLQDVTGLSGDTPEWVRDLVLLATGPFLAALVVSIALQLSVHLQSALDDELRARETLADQADELRRSRLRVVAATDRERRRIERDLHDGAQSRLVAINLALARLRTTFDGRTDGTDALDAIRHEVHLAHAELRDLAHGLYPTVLTQHGVVAAVSAAADRFPVTVRLDLAELGRHHADVEAATYFCVLEAMQNASRHAHGAVVHVRLGRSDETVWFEVSDDGVGFDLDATVGHGLTNMADRLGAIGGTLSVRSGADRGTHVSGRIPIFPPTTRSSLSV